MEWNGIAWYGLEWNGIAWYGLSVFLLQILLEILYYMEWL